MSPKRNYGGADKQITEIVRERLKIRIRIRRAGQYGQASHRMGRCGRRELKGFDWMENRRSR